MSQIRVSDGSKVAKKVTKIVITIVGKIEIDNFEDIECVRDVLDRIREYGEAEISDAELVLK
jgi:hypothetical protein